jgi:hypothetical protein
MSNQYINEHNQLVELTANQQNAGLAKPTDFIIEDRDEGQRGDSKAERAVLLALSNSRKGNMSTRGEPIADRNEVPLFKAGEKAVKQ